MKKNKNKMKLNHQKLQKDIFKKNRPLKQEVYKNAPSSIEKMSKEMKEPIYFSEEELEYEKYSEQEDL